MKSRWVRFNINLFCVLLLSAAGCSSPFGGEKSKDLAVLRLHPQVNQDGTGRSEEVSIYRSRPALVNVAKDALVHEAHILRASVVQDIGGFAIRVQFDRQGTLLLEQATTAQRGNRLAVYCRFGEEARWLAAPAVPSRITDGVFTFTPDATREEAERIVRGLNKTAEKLQK